MYTYAIMLKALGFITSVFADDDKPEELKKCKEDAENKKVKLFLCESGNCLERQIMKDLPWDEIQTIINYCCPIKI